MSYILGAIDLPPENLAGRYKVVWQEHRGEKWRGGMQKMVPFGQKVPRHPLEPAIKALQKVEWKILAHNGREGLERHRETTPYFLHVEGYYTSWGWRETVSLGRHGIILHRSPEIRARVERDTSEDQAREIIRALLSQCSDAGFFIHRYGERVDLELATEFVPQPSYADLLSQAREEGIPSDHRTNLRELITFEEKRLSVSDQGAANMAMMRILFGYSFEEDKSIYAVSAGGEFYGFNNRRAMPGYVQRAMSRYPGKPILVHRMGSELDFGLADMFGKAPLPDHPEGRRATRTAGQ